MGTGGTVEVEAPFLQFKKYFHTLEKCYSCEQSYDKMNKINLGRVGLYGKKLFVLVFLH